MTAIPTTGLSDSAQIALRHVARLLAAKFTGEIRLPCNQGGVQAVEVHTRHRPGDLDTSKGGSLG